MNRLNSIILSCFCFAPALASGVECEPIKKTEHLLAMEESLQAGYLSELSDNRLADIATFTSRYWTAHQRLDRALLRQLLPSMEASALEAQIRHSMESWKRHEITRPRGVAVEFHARDGDFWVVVYSSVTLRTETRCVRDVVAIELVHQDARWSLRPDLGRSPWQPH